ncbi:DUF4132 domain-containing protein [Actinomadura sp. 7K507]|uniref:DUF4132 domain-containing protein n=1 Tax=Actinomadura sp. 7K507 TaxID=2530365 RepID=UPI00104F1639|nr:DUF4132 domain-containing protein [Actinomadura sp. 7K507]TDC87006.1 DUF4132 domain-containing protein [Actinomadura sp. 7K507]
MLYDTLAAGARRDDGLDGVRLAALEDTRWALDLLAPVVFRELLDPRLVPGREREPWYSPLLHERREEQRAKIRAGFARRLVGCPDGEGRAFLVSVLLAARENDWLLSQYSSYLREVSSQVAGWSRDEAAVLLRCAADITGGGRFAEALDAALTAAEALEPGDLRELEPCLLRASAHFARVDVPAGYRPSLARRLWTLLETLDEAHIPDGLLPVYDTWAAALRDRTTTAPTPELARFVRHLAALSSPRPSQKWRRTCVSLADAALARDAVADCLRGLAEDEPPGTGPAHENPLVHQNQLVHQNHGDLARGIVWAAAVTGGPETLPRLDALALRMGASTYGAPEELKLAGAAINALGAIDDPGALESLWRLRAKIRNRALRKQLDTAIQAAAGRQGITPAQLVERSVPSHGLGADGALERRLGGHTARVAIEDAATVRLTFTGADGRTSRTAPAAVKDGFPDELKELKALAKEVRSTLSAERARIEGLMSDDRAWPHGEWREHYRDHPITGVLVRGLIWEFQGEDGAWRAAMASEGNPAQVRLWHPIRAAMDEIRAWRARIVDERIRQPFKQAFREIYLLTPAEEETGVYSNRFAAHIVRYPRLYALFKERGWQANFLGRYDGGHNGEARGEFGGGRWRACFHHEPADEADYAQYASTDQVRFERKDGRRWREAPVAEVPPAVFSEAMRDVDLFVGVTSIAADPEWADRGEDRYLAYWRETTFGELTGTAEVRRAALERILPRTKIAGRCSIDGRYLVVKGELRTYKIHLGSANILMEPDDSYLCVVQARGKGQGTLYLPFEDERLSLILSKAFLLAADHKISDETVLRQIRRGA